MQLIYAFTKRISIIISIVISARTVIFVLFCVLYITSNVQAQDAPVLKEHVRTRKRMYRRAPERASERISGDQKKSHRLRRRSREMQRKQDHLHDMARELQELLLINPAQKDVYGFVRSSAENNQLADRLQDLADRLMQAGFRVNMVPIQAKLKELREEPGTANAIARHYARQMEEWERVQEEKMHEMRQRDQLVANQKRKIEELENQVCAQKEQLLAEHVRKIHDLEERLKAAYDLNTHVQAQLNTVQAEKSALEQQLMVQAQTLTQQAQAQAQQATELVKAAHVQQQVAEVQEPEKAEVPVQQKEHEPEKHIVGEQPVTVIQEPQPVSSEQASEPDLEHRVESAEKSTVEQKAPVSQEPVTIETPASTSEPSIQELPVQEVQELKRAPEQEKTLEQSPVQVLLQPSTVPHKETVSQKLPKAPSEAPLETPLEAPSVEIVSPTPETALVEKTGTTETAGAPSSTTSEPTSAGAEDTATPEWHQ